MSSVSGTDDAVDPRVARSRRLILAAATDLLVEAGPRAVTVDAVSERSGVAKSTLYRHWPSRQDLLVEVMRCNMPDVEPPGPEMGFETALRHIVHQLATTLADPEWSGILPALISLQQHMPELRELAEFDTESKQEMLATVLRQGADEGAIPADLDPHLAAHVLIGPILFATLAGHAGDIHDTADYAVDRFLASYS